MKKIMSKLILTTICAITLFTTGKTYATGDISIIPEGSSSNAGTYVNQVSQGGQVWNRYRAIVNSGELSLGDQFASGIMSRETILDYVVYLVEFLSGLALLVGAVAIIYLGYEKIALQYFKGTPKGIVAVIIGILVVTFAYVIIKFLRSAFIS